MRKEDLITVNGTSIKVKELTVAEVRHWMMDMAAKEKSKTLEDNISIVLDQGLFEGIGLNDIVRMTDMSKCQIEQFAPSELQVVIQKCKELNPDFFGMRRRLVSQTLNMV